MKKILLLDFDGVLHSYKSGWQGTRNIPDPPVGGMIEWLEEFLWDNCSPPDSICAMAPEKEWQVCVYSSRSRQWGGKRAMRKWLVKHGLDYRWLEMIKFPTKKPAAFITVDDRCITFNGLTEGLTNRILTFEPWNKKRV
jgi:hypothetical protein